MIFDALVELLVGVLNGVLGLFPTYSPDFQSVGAGLGIGLAGANAVFPVTVLGVCILTIVGLRLFLVVVTFVTWIWAKVPFTFK